MPLSNVMMEDKGLIKIHSVCTDMDSIWRPTTSHDLGIDGQIEFLEHGTIISTGYIIAVQSKSGESYFENENDNHVKYYPAQKHREYWKRLNLPVILIVHDPKRDLTLYTQVKPQLHQGGPIQLKKSDIFQPSVREKLIGIVEEGITYKSPSEVLEGFMKIEYELDESHKITGIEFLLACINYWSMEYFEIRMCRIGGLLDQANGYCGFITTCDRVYEFILRCILKCHLTKLVEPFLEEFEYVWYDLNMVPDIAVPLTPVGRGVITYLWKNLDRYITYQTFNHLGCSDLLSLAKTISEYIQRISDHLDNSDKLGEVPR